jgi:hypothetical protein
MATSAISIQSDASVTTALAGDRMSGFEELYKRFYRRVYSVCLRMTGNVAEAEDLTQEVFIQLHRKLGSFRGEAAFYVGCSPSDNQGLTPLAPSAPSHDRRRRAARLVDRRPDKSETMPIDRIALGRDLWLPPGYRGVRAASMPPAKTARKRGHSRRQRETSSRNRMRFKPLPSQAQCAQGLDGIPAKPCRCLRATTKAFDAKPSESASAPLL